MIHRSNSLLLAAALLATAWLAPTASRAQMEQRCTDLGQACICSEPLDFTEAVGTIPFDPPDTEGAGAKECKGGPTLFGDESRLQINRIAGSSIGLPGVTSVLEAPASADWSIREWNRDMTGKTWCERHYLRWTTDYENPCNGCPDDKRVKGPRNQKPQGGAHPDFQSGWNLGSNGSFNWSCQGGFGTPFGKCTNAQASGDYIGFADCKGSWCRIEHCFDHNSSTGALVVRGRVTVLNANRSTAKQRTETQDFLGSNSTFITGDTTTVATTWTQNITTGTSYGTHSMVASTNRDPNFWIGPAIEVEGLAAPILLDD